MRMLVRITLVSALFSAAMWAQATAQIHGTVQDASGAAIAGAEVKATQTQTNTVRTATTGADGGYVLTNLPIGPYQLEVAKEGFSKFVQSGIVLQVNSDPLVDVSLKVGALTEQVNVEANAMLVETRNSGVGTVVETARILELPLNGRQPTDLITLSGAAVSIANTSGRGIAGAPIVNIAGGVAYGVGYTLDGANHFNYVAATTNLMPFPDALQEFKVDTSGVTAQQGSYASVSAVTRSGSNAFHGDAFEFIRNGYFNARNTFLPKRDSLKRNQFGGVVGGPIKKDKLFFFGGYQGTTIRATNASTAFVPTQAMMNGDWSAFPGCNSGRNLGGLFVNNRIDPAQYDKPAVNLLQRVLATTPPSNQCGLINFPAPSSENDWMLLGRGDYQWSDKHSFFLRYMALHTFPKPAADLTNNLVYATNPGNKNLMQSAVVGDTYLFTPNLVNSLRISTTRAWFQNVLGTFFDFCDVGINVYCGYVTNQLVLRLPGAFNLQPTLGNGAVTGGHNFNLNEDLSWIKGSHQFSFGGNPRIDYYHDSDVFFAMGQITGSSNVTGSGLADFLTGNVASISQAAPFYMYAKQVGITMYATDTWKATQRLTISYGVRWEPWLPETMLSGQTASFELEKFKQGIVSKVHPDAPPGFTYPGDPGFPNGLKGSNNNWKQFAPRVGIAFDPTGDGRTSIRASWGLSYSNVGPHMRDDQVQNAPFINLTGISVPQGGTTRLGSLDNPWTALPGGSPFPLPPGGAFTPFGDYTAIPYSLPSPYLNTWNFSVQRQIGTNWLVSASYIGSKTTHLWTEKPINYAVLVPNTAGTPLGTCPAGVTVGCNSTSNTNQRRILNLLNPNARLGNMVQFDPSGNANYNGLLLSGQHRFSRSFSLQGNWTWSHCISDFDPNPTMQAGGGEGSWTDPNNRAFDRGACNGDRRFVFNLTGVAQVPKFSNRALNIVASGWQIAPIYRWQSGQPINVLAGSDRALNGVQDFLKGNQFQRANCIGGVNPYGSSNPGAQYLNPAAFSQPAFGTLGNCPFNAFQAPAFWQFDMALSRSFPIRENQHIEIRAEAFNVTNSFRPGTCSNTNYCSFVTAPENGQVTTSLSFTNLSNPTFTRILSSMDPRIMQFALKYVF